MTTNPTALTQAATNAAANSTSSAGQAAGVAGSQQLAGDFNTFLQLLTTQLQNQDPLSPIDSNEFTTQLVEFASVQQQVDMNSNMQTLISLQQTAAATSAMQFLGTSVTVNGANAALAAGSPATWTLNSPSPANGTVTITSSTGQTAFSGSVSLNAGSNTYSWNGQGNNGTTWPAGQYTLSINATSATGQAVTVTTQVQGTVSGVNLSQNPPLVTVNGQNYPITSIQSINSGSASALSSLNSSIGNLNSSIASLTQLL